MMSKRYNTLDIIKLFASYMVVFIHVLFYGPIGVAVDALARFAVPLFFLVAGFFSYQITPDKIKDRIKHILRLFIFARITYTVIEIFPMIFQNDIGGVHEYFLKYISLKQIVELVVFNEPIHTGHLWYLLAQLYIYIFFLFVTLRKMKEKTLFSLSVFLLGVNLILGEVLSGFGVYIPVIFIRNFALTGLPFFVFGLIVKKYQYKLFEIPSGVIWLSGFAGFVCTILSRVFLGQSELYIGTLFFVFAVVLFFIKFNDIKFPSKLVSLSKCSTYIYIMHIAVASALLVFYNLLEIDYKSSLVLQMLHPIFVCILSTLVAFFITLITKKQTLIKKKRTK